MTLNSKHRRKIIITKNKEIETSKAKKNKNKNKKKCRLTEQNNGHTGIICKIQFHSFFKIQGFTTTSTSTHDLSSNSCSG